MKKKADFDTTPDERIAELERELADDPTEIIEEEVEEMLDENLE